MKSIQSIEDTVYLLVALRSRPAAFDPESVALSDHMEIGKMCDAPGPGLGRHVGEGHEIGGPPQGAIRKGPYEGGACDIASYDDYSI
ncbi:MAG: hypothetical protein ACJ8C6_03070, partial [Microvirga sp.]